jgi:hypothetical protein
MPQFSPECERVTVEIAADGDDGCILTLTEEGVPQRYEGPSKNGWRGMFDDLAAVLKGHGSGSRSVAGALKQLPVTRMLS